MSRVAARLARLTQWAGPYATLVQMVLAGLAILSVSRLCLAAWQWERVSATGILGEMLVQGVRADLILLGYLLALPLLLAPFLAQRYSARAWKLFSISWALELLLLLLPVNL